MILKRSLCRGENLLQGTSESRVEKSGSLDEIWRDGRRFDMPCKKRLEVEEI
jgi:hypothetical protein